MKSQGSNISLRNLRALEITNLFPNSRPRCILYWILEATEIMVVDDGNHGLVCNLYTEWYSMILAQHGLVVMVDV